MNVACCCCTDARDYCSDSEIWDFIDKEMLDIIFNPAIEKDLRIDSILNFFIKEIFRRLYFKELRMYYKLT